MFKKFIAITVLSFALLAPFVPQAALAQSPNLGSQDLGSTEYKFNLNTITHEAIEEQNYIRGGLNFVFSRIISIMAGTIGSIAVLMMVIGGFLMLTSAGMQDQYDKGKNLVKKAALGIVFVLGAYVIVATVQLLITTIV